MDSKHRPTRRDCLMGVAGVSLPLALAATRSSTAAEPRTAGLGTAELSTSEPPPMSGAEALQRLKAGNKRFAEGRVQHAHQAAAWREQLTGSQHPFATILACSDSRVPPELVFDQGFGDLFVIRVAGNVIASDVVGSIQYALVHLRTPLVVVMGHEGCGAVTAAIESLDGKGTEPKYINLLVDRIKPGLADIPEQLPNAERVHLAVEANVRWAMKQLAQFPEGKQHIENKTVTLAGAVYQLDSGTVRFLD